MSRTAVVHDWLTGMRGGEKVLEELLRLLPEAEIFTLFHFPGTVSETIEGHRIHTSWLQRAPGLRRHYRRYLPLFPEAIESLDLSGFDLVVSTSHCVAKGAIPAPGARHLCYCHTPMRYAWDQRHAYFPRDHGLVGRLRSRVLASLRTWDVASAPRVDRFVANSAFVAERIRRYYGRDADVVNPPVEIGYFTPGGGAGGDYYVAVSALAPYKRLEVAIAACESLGHELRIVGDGPERRRLERLAGPRTHLLGKQSAEELRRLLRGARAFLQPGVEDFGIAPAEALACGTPVVARGLGGVLDIVEDGTHGVLYAGDDAAALAAALERERSLSWEPASLRRQAERFSAAIFRHRMRALLETDEPASETPHVASSVCIPEGSGTTR